MTRNVGNLDRLFRLLGATMMITCGFLAPLPPSLRPLLFIPGVYMLGTALLGSCLGYRLMGKNTCALPARKA